MIIYYNNQALNQKTKAIDYTLIVFTTLNLLCIMVEMVIFKVYLGRGVNLD